MDLVKLSKVFDIKYGNQLNFNAMAASADGVNFVTRSRTNMGICGKVKRIVGKSPFSAGLITVTLGGTYLLSSFVQPEEFYTAQNIKVLRPRADMSFEQKVAYCIFIERNRFRYSSHGREANRSLDALLVPPPEAIPAWAVMAEAAPTIGEAHPLTQPPYGTHSWDAVELFSLFRPVNGISTTSLRRAETRKDGNYVPLVRPSRTQIGSFVEYVDRSAVDKRHIYPAETLYVSTNGQGSHTYAYVSAGEFVPNSDVSVLIPKRDMSLQEKLFYALCISKNRGLFSYGRKPKGKRLNALLLPRYPPEYVYSKDFFAFSRRRVPAAEVRRSWL